MRNGGSTRTVLNMLEGRPMRHSRLSYHTEQGTNVPLVTLCYRTEQGTNGHILLSVHGFAITSYLLASMVSEAAIGQRHVVQLRPRAGPLASAGRGCPSGRARPTLPSAGHQGMARGFLQGKS